MLDLEREEGERPMLRRPGAGGGDGGHPGGAPRAGVGGGGSADLGREGMDYQLWEEWGKFRAVGGESFMGAAFLRWVWWSGAAAAETAWVAQAGRRGFGLSWAGPRTRPFVVHRSFLGIGRSGIFLIF